jgi:hypothetical protein
MMTDQNNLFAVCSTYLKLSLQDLHLPRLEVRNGQNWGSRRLELHVASAWPIWPAVR